MNEVANYWNEYIGFKIPQFPTAGGGVNHFHPECAAERAPTLWALATEAYDETDPEDSVPRRFAEAVGGRILTRRIAHTLGEVRCRGCGEVIR